MPVRRSHTSTSLPRAASDPRFETASVGERNLDPPSDSRWRDGRSVGRHIVDRALDYAALHQGGLTAAQIARRRKKSKGYVSIVLRLGTALRRLDSEEIAVFRSERITWKLAQRIVRSGVTDAEIQRQLRYALGGFSTHNIDRRKLRTRRGRRSVTEGAGTQTGDRDTTLARSAPEADTFIWRWDAAWAARDPLGYVEAYRAHLASLHRAVRARFADAAATRASTGVSGASPAPIPVVGQSLRHIMALVARQRASGSAPVRSALSRSALTPADREALAALAALDALVGGDQSPGVATDAREEESGFE